MNHNHPNTSNKRILVTGGEGTVAGYIHEVFKDYEVLLEGKKSLDITKKHDVDAYLNDTRPDYIIHLAALTDVDLCETNPELALEVNFQGTKNITEGAQKLKIPLVYISTSAVFDGENPPSNGYKESDTPRPINYYAKTKLLGEKIIQDSLDDYIIVRAAWMIGGGKKEKKFISYILEKMQNGEEIKAVNDKFGTLTYAKDLVVFIRRLIEAKDNGLYHYSSYGFCSRFDIAIEMKKLLNSSSSVHGVSSQEFAKKFPAPRPTHEVLGSEKIPFIKDWKTVLTDYIKTELL